MASRENQGLQIALILMVMLTAGLCLTTWVFYSKSETRRAESEDARNKLSSSQDQLKTALFKNQTLKYSIKGGAKTWKQMEEDLVNIPGNSGGDPELDQMLKSFRENMMLFGAEEEEYESARNYESLPKFLMGRIRDLNQQLSDLRATEQKLTAEKAALTKSEADRSKKFEDAQQKARDDLLAQIETFKQDRDKLTKQSADLAGQLTTKDDKIVELQTTMADREKDLTGQINDLQTVVVDQKNLLVKLRQTSFEVPDAVVTSVNQKESVVYIDVGSADNLNRQQTFSVFDKGTLGVMQAEPKGRLEVIQVLGDHVAMCKILEDSLSAIIIPGDVVFTPVWAPGRQIHFAIAGFIDMTGDDRSDMDLLKSLIAVNGGVVDDDVSVQTRYLVQGEATTAGPGQEMTSDERADFTKKITAAQQIGVDRLSIDKLLSLMGWNADVRAVRLGRGGEDFKATPSKTPPAGDVESSPFRKRTPPRGGDGAF